MAPISRREFLRASIATAAGVCLGELPCAASPKPSGDRVGVLVDLTRCIGCRACTRACNARNGLPQDPRSATAWTGEPERLSYNRWTAVNISGADGDDAIPVKRQCMHCLQPACASVCPVGALQSLPIGAVVYKPERCIGCRYCVFACPFDVPKFQWDAGVTPVIGKCQLCAQHADFSGPACAAACPTGTLKFGHRDELLREARARIQNRPDRYVGHIYGEREAGGTGWLYLSGRPFAQLGFKSNLPETPLPQLTWVALKAVPMVVTVLAVALSALSARLRPREPAEAPTCSS